MGQESGYRSDRRTKLNYKKSALPSGKFFYLGTGLQVGKLIIQVLIQNRQDFSSIVGDFRLYVFRKLTQHIQGGVTYNLVLVTNTITLKITIKKKITNKMLVTINNFNKRLFFESIQHSFVSKLTTLIVNLGEYE